MAVKGYFYNATSLTDTERQYNGEDMNQDKAPFYKEGVCFGQLQVTAPGEKMAVLVDGGPKTGYAFINLHTIHNTTVLELPISQANGTLPRIDRVVIRNDQAERKPSIYVLEGAYSSAPQPKNLTNNETIQEKCLAEIYVAAGAVEITQADITDTRADETLCGYIASQFDNPDFSQWAAQFEAQTAQTLIEFNQEADETINNFNDTAAQNLETQTENWETWFNTIKGQLGEDVAGSILNLIEAHKSNTDDPHSINFNAATTRANITSGEKLSLLFGKIAKFFTDLKTVAFSGSYNDLTNKPQAVDNLLSTSTTQFLSSNQGRVLDEKIKDMLPGTTDNLVSGLKTIPANTSPQTMRIFTVLKTGVHHFKGQAQYSDGANLQRWIRIMKSNDIIYQTKFVGTDPIIPINFSLYLEKGSMIYIYHHCTTSQQTVTFTLDVQY